MSYKRSEEQKLAISKRMIGNKNSLGAKRSQETKDKLKKSLKGKAGKFVRTEEYKQRMREISLKNGNKPPSSKGRIVKESTREKLRKINLGRKNPLSSLKQKGVPKSKETCEKMRLAKLNNPTRYWLGKKRLDNSGEKNYFWKDGKSKEPYTIDWTNTLKRSIRERDHYTCKICGKQQEETTFCIHHIDYNKKNCSPSNLVTLCRSCHTKTNSNRESWILLFNKLLNI